MSGFDIAHEIVVDADVPNLAPVLDLPLSNVDALDKPQEGGAVKFLSCWYASSSPDKCALCSSFSARSASYWFISWTHTASGIRPITLSS